MYWSTGIFLLFFATLVSSDKIPELAELLGSYLPPSNSFGDAAPKDIFQGLALELPGQSPAPGLTLELPVENPSSGESSSAIDDISDEPSISHFQVPFKGPSSSSNFNIDSNEASESNLSDEGDDHIEISSNPSYVASSINKEKTELAPAPICILPNPESTRKTKQPDVNSLFPPARKTKEDKQKIRQPLIGTTKPFGLNHFGISVKNENEHSRRNDSRPQENKNFKNPVKNPIRTNIGESVNSFKSPSPDYKHSTDSHDDGEKSNIDSETKHDRNRSVTKKFPSPDRIHSSPLPKTTSIFSTPAVKSASSFMKFKGTTEKQNIFHKNLRPIPAKPRRKYKNPQFEVSSEEINRNKLDASLFFKMPSLPTEENSDLASNEDERKFQDRTPSGSYVKVNKPSQAFPPISGVKLSTRNPYSSTSKTLKPVSISSVPTHFTASSLRNRINPQSKLTTLNAQKKITVKENNGKIEITQKHNFNRPTKPHKRPTQSFSTPIPSSTGFKSKTPVFSTSSVSRQSSFTKKVRPSQKKVQDNKQRFSTISTPSRNTNVFGAKIVTNQPIKTQTHRFDISREKRPNTKSPFTIKSRVSKKDKHLPSTLITESSFIVKSDSSKKIHPTQKTPSNIQSEDSKKISPTSKSSLNFTPKASKERRPTSQSPSIFESEVSRQSHFTSKSPSTFKSEVSKKTAHTQKSHFTTKSRTLSTRPNQPITKVHTVHSIPPHLSIQQTRFPEVEDSFTPNQPTVINIVRTQPRPFTEKKVNSGITGKERYDSNEEFDALSKDSVELRPIASIEQTKFDSDEEPTIFKKIPRTRKPFSTSRPVDNRVKQAFQPSIKPLVKNVDDSKETSDVRRGSLLLSEPQAPDKEINNANSKSTSSKNMKMMMPYEFNWEVDDGDSGNNFGQTAVSDGMVERGKYFVLLPDGRKQIVTYLADWETGYHVKVTYEGEANTSK